MKPLRILFMGTPEFAAFSLESLLREGYEVAAVVTAPDRPAGRGQKVQQSAVKRKALENGIPVLQPEKLKDPVFLEKLKALDCNLQVVVAFRMLPREVWDLPELGTFNLHASLLPNYRGAAPINWVIMNGDEETGVTTFFIDDQIDTGAIILQRKTSVGAHETAGELHDRLMEMGAALICETVSLIAAGQARPVAQPPGADLHPAPKLNKETCKIQWGLPLQDVYNHIRGLSPYPGAWGTLVNGGEHTPFKVFLARPVPDSHTFPPGTLRVEAGQIRVAVPGGWIRLDEIQLAGKRRLKVQEVLHGLTLQKNAYMS